MGVSLIIVFSLVALAGIYVVVTYNRLVEMRNRCESSWSQIDVALKLRHDLVPVLADTVAGYAGHERETLEEVTRARASAVASGATPSAARGAAEAVLGTGIGNVLVLAEEYPALLAAENFTKLQNDLRSVEEKISITRRVYNDTVEGYNTKIQVFPPVIVARLFGFTRREFFDAPVEVEAAPEVVVSR